MKKFLVIVGIVTLFITGCTKEQEPSQDVIQETVNVQVEQEIKEEVKSEEIMKRVETSNLGESVPLPDNFPISYVPIIDGAQIIQAESTVEADKTVFNVTQSVNLVPADAYLYYMELYETSPSYTIEDETEGEKMTVERSKNGLVAALKFVADGEGKSNIVMEVSLNN